MIAESLIALVGLVSLRMQSTTEWPVFGSLPLAAYVTPNNPPPKKKQTNRYGVETSARSSVVMDVKSGEVLWEKNGSVSESIASITKIMTAMVFLDGKSDLDQEMTMEPDDDPKEDGKTVFAPHERLLKRDMLKALLIGSYNAAGNALARTSPGGRDMFVKAMNAKAQTLGLRTAVFVDPTGLDARNQASARDVAILLRTALAYPEIRDITKLEKIELKGRATRRSYQIRSTNLLLESFLNKPPYRIVAAKTGSLPEAGFCLAQVTRNASGNEIAVVVLGSENHYARFQDMKALTYWTYQNYRWPQVAGATDEVEGEGDAENGS